MEKEKRGNKKKGGKKILAAAACIGLLAAAGGFFFWQKSNADAAEGAVVIEAGENGEIIYAQIDNIVGNDIDVSIMEETASGSGNTGQNVSGQNAVEPGNGGQEISGRENGAWDMPDGMPQGMPADMSDGTPQGMPDGAGVMGDVGDEGGNSTRNSTRNSTKGSTGNNAGSVSAFTDTGETRSFEIPAGTQVITKLGVETTFSRLSAGNIIALLLEKGTNNILKIWVVS
ncbi:hypothetical protein [Eisenbergiella porci]|uniref:hypothetical protein n=1 Tax=Eisenbergiella porci TaxID=2652274 RepID=UPI0022DF6501|nr:hypothetical protein [Eisenbergiella porci]